MRRKLVVRFNRGEAEKWGVYLAARARSVSLAVMITSSVARRWTATGRLDQAVGCAWRCAAAPRRLQTSRHFSPLAWYNRQIERSPLITKSITSGGKRSMHTQSLSHYSTVHTAYITCSIFEAAPCL